MQTITLANGLLSVEGGVSLSGVSLEMVTSLREVYMSLSGLVQALDNHPALADETSDLYIQYDVAKKLLNYLRETRKISASTGEVKGKHNESNVQNK